MNCKWIIIKILTVLTLSAYGGPIHIVTTQQMSERCPLIVKGVVKSVVPMPSATEAFPGFHDNAWTSKAEVEIEYVIKGDVHNNHIICLFEEGAEDLLLTKLEIGHEYILFLEESQYGLQVCDPHNAAISALPGIPDDKPKDIIGMLRTEAERLLLSEDKKMVMTGIAELASVGDRDSLKKLATLLASKDEPVWFPACTTAIALGEWSLLPKVVQYLDNHMTEGVITTSDEDIIPFLRIAIKQIESLSNQVDQTTLHELLRNVRSSNIRDALERSLESSKSQ